MKQQYIQSGYSITTDPDFQNERYNVPRELSQQLEKLAIESQKKPTSKIVVKLNQLIIKYPQVPQLKNYLSVAFSKQGKHAKAIEVNNWTLTEHPDYLFAKINAAHICIDNNDFQKVPEFLGNALEIKSLYPERDVFHLAEVTSYLKVVIRYLAAVKELELAENRLALLQEIAPDHHDTHQAEVFLWPLRAKSVSERLDADFKNRITPVNLKVVEALSNNTPPQFNHPQISNLYQYGLYIPREELQAIITLPRATLIADLETVLDDAVNRYGYFKKQKYNENNHSIVLHAFFILSEIRAEESLPKLLSFLEWDDNFLDYWFGDHLTNTVWQCIYKLAFSNTAIVKPFLIKPGINTYSKTCVSDALNQMVLHHPERRPEILNVFEETFTFFTALQPDENVIDSDFLGLAISDTIDCNLHELKPVIKTLYNKGYVSLSINGDFNEVEELFRTLHHLNYKRKIYNIFDLYEHITTTWAGYTEDSEDDYDPFLNITPQQPAQITKKVERNDPCPCGSGKKYKKCCLDKE